MSSPESEILEGWISDYWEQGMERQPDRIFQDKRFCGSRTENWNRKGMFLLEPGDKLTIFDEQDEILWSGILEKRRNGCLGLTTFYPSDYEWFPKDVEFETWESWFKHQPPLKATFSKRNVY